MAADAQDRIVALIGVMEPLVSPPPPLIYLFSFSAWQAWSCLVLFGRRFFPPLD